MIAVYELWNPLGAAKRSFSNIGNRIGNTTRNTISNIGNTARNVVNTASTNIGNRVSQTGQNIQKQVINNLQTKQQIAQPIIDKQNQLGQKLVKLQKGGFFSKTFGAWNTNRQMNNAQKLAASIAAPSKIDTTKLSFSSMMQNLGKKFTNNPINNAAKNIIQTSKNIPTQQNTNQQKILGMFSPDNKVAKSFNLLDFHPDKYTFQSVRERQGTKASLHDRSMDDLIRLAAAEEHQMSASKLASLKASRNI